MPTPAVQGFRVSPLQGRQWLVREQLWPPYGRALLELDGPLDHQALRRAARLLLERHEILRTDLVGLPGLREPVQVVAEEAEPEWQEIDLDPAFPPGGWEALAREMERRAGAPAAAAAPGTSFALGRLGAEHHLLSIRLPAHAIDDWGCRVLVAELAAAYARPGEYRGASAEAVQYAQFSEWCHEILGEDGAGDGRQHWRAVAEAARPWSWPEEARGDPEVSPAAWSRLPVRLEGSLVGRLEALAQARSVPLAALLSTAWRAVLAQHSGDWSAVLFEQVPGRKFEELAATLGLFAGSLPVPVALPPGASFEQAVERTARAQAQAELWCEHFRGEESAGGSPRPAGERVGFQLEPRASEAAAGEVVVRLAWRRLPEEPQLLKLSLESAPGRLDGELAYAAHRLRPAEALELGQQLVAFLAAAGASPGRPIADLGLTSPPARHALLVEPHGAGVVASPSRTVDEEFDRAAGLYEELPAVTAGGRTLTYGELKHRVDRLGRALVELRVGPESRVALALDRSLETVVAMLGVLRAGGAYLPLEPGLPPKRVATLLGEAGASLVLAQAEHQLGETPGGCPVVLLAAAEASAPAAGELPRRALPAGAAYVLFTSGSTGKPKAVAVEHRHLLAYLAAIRLPLAVEPGMSFALVSSFAADLGNTSIFPSLLGGGHLHVLAGDEATDPAAFRRYLAAHRIDVLKVVPSHLLALLDGAAGPESLPRRTLVLGGEALRPELLRTVRELAPACRVLGHYGPTETTVGVMVSTPFRGAEAEAERALGRPLGGCRVYRLDRRLNLAPRGTVGELYVGGESVARGYLGRPALTAERFLPDPYALRPGARMYRTGDRAHLLPSGELRFEGRADHQVKLRGFRVELGEIEAALAEHPRVREAVVVLREGALPVLAGYVVAREKGAAAEADLRSYLAERLPQHMVPALLVELDRLPLSSNGKVDRQALPEPQAELAGGAGHSTGPRNPIEETVAGLWAEVLGTPVTDVHASFFDLGGHSLLATQVVSRLRAAFQAELDLARFFAAPTVAGVARQVAAALHGGGAPELPAIEPAPRPGELPLSFAQERLWFMHQLDLAGAAYNVPRAVELAGSLDARSLAGALAEVRRRHQVLRTVFPSSEGEARQAIQPASRLQAKVVDLSRLPAAAREGEGRRLAAAEAVRPFDLARGPLLRACLLRLAGDRHWALLTLHHIVSDAWSMALLIDEMSELYAAAVGGREARLPALAVQYADFAWWQRRVVPPAELERQIAFWRQQLAGAVAEVLPPDRPRPAVPSFAGGHLVTEIPAATLRELQEIGRREGVTLFMTLLAGFKALLGRATGRTDLVVGTDVANRSRLETERLIGFFINHLVLRTDLAGDPPFRELLARVRAATLSAYTHQDLPFDRLVKALAPERQPGRTPLFQLLFVLQNAPRSTLRLPALTLSGLEVEAGSSKFDLALFVSQAEGGLALSWVYRSELFRPATIARLAAQLAALLASACRDPSARLSQLELRHGDGAEAGAAADRRHRARLAGLRRSPASVPGGGQESAGDEGGA